MFSTGDGAPCVGPVSVGRLCRKGRARHHHELIRVGDRCNLGLDIMLLLLIILQKDHSKGHHHQDAMRNQCPHNLSLAPVDLITATVDDERLDSQDLISQ